jgi:hypothetical protein
MPRSKAPQLGVKPNRAANIGDKEDRARVPGVFDLLLDLSLWHERLQSPPNDETHAERFQPTDFSLFFLDGISLFLDPSPDSEPLLLKVLDLADWLQRWVGEHCPAQ